MKIAIDINELASKKNTGVKTYTREIVNGLMSIDKNNRYILYSGKNVNVSSLENSGNFELKVLDINFPFWTYTIFSSQVKKDKPNVLFMPIQTSPFFQKPKGMKIVVTVHDLAFLIFPDHFSYKNKFLLSFDTKKAIKMADRIITPSQTTKKDIIKFYGVKEDAIDIIYHGVSLKSDNYGKFDFDAKKQEEIKEYKPYILFVGTIQPRKNIIRLIEAFEIVKNSSDSKFPNLKLVICGGEEWMSEIVREKAKKSKVSKNIIFTGNVSNDHLAELYKNALIFVLPSIYEGFGLPVLEAMSYGLPCVVGDTPTLSEIVDDNALLANIYSSAGIAG